MTCIYSNKVFSSLTVFLKGSFKTFINAIEKKKRIKKNSNKIQHRIKDRKKKKEKKNRKEKGLRANTYQKHTYNQYLFYFSSYTTDVFESNIVSFELYPS